MLGNILHIDHMIRRMATGVTEPFLCECDDGIKYVIKGQPRVTRKELMAEWISAQLAHKLGLSIPDSFLVYVDEDVISFSKPEWKEDLREGHAFACRYVDQSIPITFYQAHSNIDIQTRKFIYLFDKWINNSDRTLSSKGLGNVNLLFNVLNNRYYLIDHNLAFFQDYHQEEFESHVYCPNNRDWTFDLLDAQEFRDRLISVASDFDNLASSIPEDWKLDDPASQEAFLNFLKNTLERATSDEFWSNLI